MKKLLLSIIICMTVYSDTVSAQIITSSQLFPDSTIAHLSMGGGKMGWVTRNVNHYQHHIMDTLLNITTFQDTNLDYRTLNTGTGFFTGNYFCGSTMDKNGNLIGLFFDDNSFSDSLQSMTAGPYPGFICHYWYNFTTQQRTNFSYTNVAEQFFPMLNNASGTITNFSYKIIWSEDTLILRSNYLNSINHNGVCLKFLNNILIEAGTTSSFDGNMIKCFTDLDNKINTLFQYDWVISDGVNYNQLNSNFNYYSDAVKDSIGNLYIKYVDSLKIINNASTSVIAAPNTGSYWMQTICADHLNRVWMISDDSVSVYNNSTWQSFPLNFNNFENMTMQLAGWHSVFFEYAPNKFVMSWATDIGLKGGNGLIFFTFNDTSTVTNNAAIYSAKKTFKVYPNPASNFITVHQLTKTGFITIADVMGNEVISINAVNKKENIDVSNLSNGIYFVNINNTEVQKIVINK